MSKLVLGQQVVIARRLGPGKYTWTLPSLLGDMLQLAQEWFGERDREWTILGVEFCGDHPRVWCPGNRRDIVVQVAVRCMDEPQRAAYQLAHECVHLIAPIGCKDSSVLEEGLATWFAQYYMAERIGNPNWRSTMYSYTVAQEKAEKLLALDKDAIKKLRAEIPQISYFTKDLLLKHYPELGEPLAAELTSRFNRNLQPAASGEEAPTDNEAGNRS